MRASRSLVYATAAALPAHLLHLDAGPLSTSALEVLVLLTLLVFGIEVYASGVRPRWPGAFTGPMWLLAAAVPIAVAVSPDRLAAWDVVRLSLLEPAAFFGVACSVLRGPGEMGRFVRALLLGGAVVSCIVLGAFAHAAATGRPDILASPPILWYPRAAAAGLLITPLIALASALLLFTPAPLRSPDRLWSALFLIVAVPAAALTLSEAAWLALAAVAVVLAAVHSRRRLLVPTMAALAGAALLAAPARGSVAVDVSVSRAPSAGVDSRAQLWHDATEMVLARPLSGIGVGALAARNAAGEPLDVVHRDDPSNLVLAFWLRFGLLGLVGLAWFATRAARWLEALRFASARVRPLVIGSGTALLAVLVGGILDTTFFAPDLALCVLSVCALVATAARLERVRLRALLRVPLAAHDIEPAELPMPADIPRRTGRFPALPPSV